MVSDEWVLGFVEGEGCFNISLQLETDRKPRKTGHKNVLEKPSLGFRLMPSFRIVLRHDDLGTLKKIREKLGVGQIYLNKRPPQRHCQAIAHYYVVGLQNLVKIRDFFKEKEFQSKKGKDFRLWGQCLELILQKRHLTKEGLLEICRLRDQMNSRTSKGNRTAETIQAILESGREHIAAHQNHNENTLSYT